MRIRPPGRRLPRAFGDHGAPASGDTALAARWVAEVGGPIAPDNEAHDLIMSVFGGVSKGERTRIRVRLRLPCEQELAAMSRTAPLLGRGRRLADWARA